MIDEIITPMLSLFISQKRKDNEKHHHENMHIKKHTQSKNITMYIYASHPTRSFIHISHSKFSYLGSNTLKRGGETKK
jgi:hypothetical protein